MQKLQVLFPEPEMRRLRQAAEEEDRALSEVVRRATEAWLDRRATRRASRPRPAVPVFDGGKVLVPAASLRESAWDDRTTAERRAP